MRRPDWKKTILYDSDGSAVVEATFVFPVMFMVFFALVMLAFYLPQRAMLQRATQFAATAVATEMSDTWVYYNEEVPARHGSHAALSADKGQVYVTLFNSMFGDAPENAEPAVENIDAAENIPVIANGDLTVECTYKNYIAYKEFTVTATRKIAVPVDFSVIQFPRTIDLTVSSTAVSNNGDEFIRNVDLAVVFVEWAAEKLGVSDIFAKINSAGETIGNFFGI